jgi:hypothetical protein
MMRLGAGCRRTAGVRCGELRRLWTRKGNIRYRCPMPNRRPKAAKPRTPLGLLYRAVQFAYAPATPALYKRVRSLVGVPQRPPADPVAALRAAQRVVVDKLTKIARARDGSRDVPIWHGAVAREAALIKGRLVLTSTSDLAHAYPHYVLRLLEQVGLDPLHTCPAKRGRGRGSPCGRVFIKLRRKTFCSATCQARQYARVQRRATAKAAKAAKVAA